MKHLKKSTEVFGDTFAFNTLIAACMEALNAINAQDNDDVNAEGFFIILNLLEPIVPHIANELSEELFGRKNFHKDSCKRRGLCKRLASLLQLQSMARKGLNLK